MISFHLSQAAQVLHGELRGGDAVFSSVSTDTRTLTTGDLFVALSGPHFDGHDYLALAEQQGAMGAMVQKEVRSSMPLLRVADTRLALGGLASAWRDKAPAQVVGITGSNGKTTLKEMVAAILRQQDSVLFTRGNLNNDIGMPLTLLQLQDERYAVIEMGANHAGEIGYLSRIAKPDVAVLNNAGRAHLEGFGSVEGVARAKAEILEGLGPDGVFVFNADDRYAPLWRELSQGYRRVGFGLDQRADVRSAADSYQLQWKSDRFETAFEVITPGGSFELGLQLAGEHNRMNALAAVAVAQVLGMESRTICDGLASVAPVKGRLCPAPAIAGARLVDDSYNANPDSVAAAIAVLRVMPGRRTLVLGDLGELGPDQVELHRELGVLATQAGIDRLFACGSLSAHAAEAFQGEKRVFEDHIALVGLLKETLSADDSILVKGSRASGMDRVVAAMAPEVIEC